MTGAAWISDDNRYRYWLSRNWSDGSETRGSVCWVMLNPSTADADVDDPTVRKCIGFSRAWGFGGLVIVNLFALRATDPRALIGSEDPVGQHNFDVVHNWLGDTDLAVAAWGQSYPVRYRPYTLGMLERVRSFGGKCLGRTAAGDPRHPLMLAYATELVSL